jgi:hypothetical protein
MGIRLEDGVSESWDVLRQGLVPFCTVYMRKETKGNFSLQDVHIMDGSEQEDRDLKVSIPGSGIFINFLDFSVFSLAFYRVLLPGLL